jgi:predicted flavoprotein YhiN
MKLTKSQLKQIIKEELENIMTEAMKSWCVEYTVDGETQYSQVSATAGGVAETNVRSRFRKQDKKAEIVSTRELDSGQKCGA